MFDILLNKKLIIWKIQLQARILAVENPAEKVITLQCGLQNEMKLRLILNK